MKNISRGMIAAAIASVLGLFVAGRVARAEIKGDTMAVYFGTYTRGESEGIYRSELDLASGELTEAKLAGKAVNPSFLAIHPDGNHLYSVMEVETLGGRKTGGVGAFALDHETGRLAPINQQESGGGGPCHLIVDHTGKNVLVANYGGGSIACLPIQENGGIAPASTFIQHQGSSVNPQRQTGPHAHSINVDAANRYAFVADLGLDKVLIYAFDASTGKLTPNDPDGAALAGGAGPRHFAFRPGGRHAYVINEIHSTVTAFEYDAESGALHSLQTISTLPADHEGGNSTAEVQVHPSGKFLYGSNRGHDSIAMFAIADDGRLERKQVEPTRGKTPRNFGIDPTGQYLLAANQSTDNVAVFRIDAANGELKFTGQILDVPSPVCVKFLAL